MLFLWSILQNYLKIIYKNPIWPFKSRICQVLDIWYVVKIPVLIYLSMPWLLHLFLSDPYVKVQYDTFNVPDDCFSFNKEQIISGCAIDGASSVRVDCGFGSYRWFVYITTLLLRDASWILILVVGHPNGLSAIYIVSSVGTSLFWLVHLSAFLASETMQH